MGYASVVTVDMILAQALTSARPDGSSQKIKLINIGEVRDLNRISNEIVEHYISQADLHIDGILTQQYYTPFERCAHGQWYLEEDINVPEEIGSSGVAVADSAGNAIVAPLAAEDSSIIILTDASNLVPGDVIMIHNDKTGEEEDAIVAEVIDRFTIQTLVPIEGIYRADDGIRVIRVTHPPPLPQISARRAASFIYDKYFSAQNSPNVSDYGNEMRDVADGQLNDILNGRVILKCAKRKGDFFGDPWIESTYAHRPPSDGYDGNEKNMSKGRK